VFLSVCSHYTWKELHRAFVRCNVEKKKKRKKVKKNRAGKWGVSIGKWKVRKVTTYSFIIGSQKVNCQWTTADSTGWGNFLLLGASYQNTEAGVALRQRGIKKRKRPLVLGISQKKKRGLPNLRELAEDSSKRSTNTYNASEEGRSIVLDGANRRKNSGLPSFQKKRRRKKKISPKSDTQPEP